MNNDFMEIISYAAKAPSGHNTQPWRFRIRGHALEMLVDPERQLEVIDPGSRQLVISCGCALFNARVGVAASRYSMTVERFPEPGEPDLFARIIAQYAPASPGAMPAGHARAASH